MDFSCTSEDIGSCTVITIAGELDLYTCRQLRVALETAGAPEKSKHIVLDMSDVAFVDSAGLGVLITAEKKPKRLLHVVVTRPEVLTVLTVTGLDKVIALYSTRAGAIDAMCGKSRSAESDSGEARSVYSQPPGGSRSMPTPRRTVDGAGDAGASLDDKDGRQ